MGLAMARPPAPVRQALDRAGLAFDAMATGHAVATYNLLLEERRKVAAALIAVDLAGMTDPATCLETVWCEPRQATASCAALFAPDASAPASPGALRLQCLEVAASAMW